MEGIEDRQLVEARGDMAWIDKVGDKYKVRWRDGDGRKRSKTAPSLKAAKTLKREVEEVASRGADWEPPRVGNKPDLREVHREYLRDAARLLSKTTVYRYAVILEIWEKWLIERFPNQRLGPDLLSRRLLSDHFEALTKEGRHGGERSQATVYKHITVIQTVWRWASEDDIYAEHTPRPRRLPMAQPAQTPVVAPTWAQMDHVIHLSSTGVKELAILLRFTGLRVEQAMSLKWTDLDLSRGLLTVRGELGKSRQERSGRIVPLSPHFLEVLQGWPRLGLELIGPALREKSRQAREREISQAWRTAGVPEAVWKRRPHHAFRKGFQTELTRSGGNPEAIEYLVGHSRGIRGHYVDAEALHLRRLVAMIPPLGRPLEEGGEGGG